MPEPQLQYNIFGLGFNKHLSRETPLILGELGLASLMGSSFYESSPNIYEGTMNNMPTTSISGAFDSSGNVITELINEKLNTATKEILGDFTFGASVAIKMITDADNGLWISPTGILGKKTGATTFSITTSGDVYLKGELAAAFGTLGALTITSGGNIKLGQTAYNTGTGWWLGDDAGTPKFSIGNPTGNRLTWDGSALNIRGQLNADDITAGTLTGRDYRTTATAERGIKILTSQYEAGAPYGYIEFWTNVGDATFVYIDSNANFNIEGGHLIVQANIYTPTSGATLGTSTYKWYTIYRTNEVACALPTSNSAIDIFKKIKRPEIMGGDYGERHYFKVKDFPSEMKFENDKKELDIEFTRTLGVSVQAIRELIEKVEKLENKLK